MNLDDLRRQVAKCVVKIAVNRLKVSRNQPFDDILGGGGGGGGAGTQNNLSLKKVK